MQGLYRGAQNNEMRLGVCSRTNDVVEPMIKPQWYVNCNGMAKQALDAVMDENRKKIEIIPKQYTAEWKRYISEDAFLAWNIDQERDFYTRYIVYLTPSVSD